MAITLYCCCHIYISSGALESPDLLLLYSVIALALHITIILIINHLSTPKSTDQVLNDDLKELLVAQKKYV